MGAAGAAPEEFKYWAFISYSHADERFAACLHRRIETFAVPRPLIGRRNALGEVPRRLRPVFRDRDELPTSADLGGHLKSALGHSRFLVVVCSRQSAQSRWVNEEVATFKRLGRADRILCVIIDGEPNAGDKGEATSECFCPALRFAFGPDGAPSAARAEPIAADARPGRDGRAVSFLKIAAGLLGVNFDDLRQRHRRRLRMRIAAWSAAAAVLILGVSGAGTYLETQRRAEESARLAQESREAAVRVDDLISREDYGAALRIALDALPTDLARPERPVESRLLAQLKRIHHSQGLRHVLGGHGGLAGAAVVSPRGDRVVTASLDESAHTRPVSNAGEVFLWDAKTGTRIATLLGPGYSILGDAIQFSADGRFVALNLRARRSFGTGGWRIYSAFDGRMIDSPRTEEKVATFAWGPEAIAVIGGEDGTVTIYDYAAARALADWRTPRDGTSLSYAAFNPEGRLVAGTIDDLPEVHLWRVSDGGFIGTFDGHAKSVRSLRFVDDGRALLTIGADETVRIWNVESRRTLHTLGPVDASEAEVSLPSRRAITATEWGGGRATLWSLETSKAVDDDWASDAKLMRFLSGGRRLLVVPSRPDALPRIVETRSGKELAVLEAAAWEQVDDATLSADGRVMLARTHGRRAYVFDSETGRRLASLLGHGGHIVDATMSLDGSVLATASHDGTARIWSFGQDRRPIIMGDWVADARFSADSRALLTAYRNRPPDLIGFPQGDPIRTFALPERSAILAGVVAPDGSWAFLSQSYGTAAWLVGPRYGDKFIALRAPDYTLRRLAARAHRAMAVAENSVQVWDTGNGELLLDLSSIRGGVRSATLSSDGTKVAIIAGFIGGSREEQHKLVIHAVPGGRRLAVVDILYPQVASFDPAGRRLLAAGTEGGAAIFDAGNGALLRSIAARGLEVEGMGFSPDGQLAKLVSKNGDVHLYDSETGRLLAVLRQPEGRALASRITAEGRSHAVVFDPTGRHVATATAEGTVLIWDARIATVIARYVTGVKDVRAVYWSPDGRRLIFITLLGALRIATFDPPGDREILEWARRLDGALREAGSPR
jgi:WD40 repeat protein